MPVIVVVCQMFEDTRHLCLLSFDEMLDDSQEGEEGERKERNVSKVGSWLRFIIKNFIQEINLI